MKPRTPQRHKPRRFYWAHLETPKYDFDAFGATQDEAIATLRLAWTRHRRAHGQWRNHMYKWSELKESVAVTIVGFREPLRDMEPL